MKGKKGGVMMLVMQGRRQLTGLLGGIFGGFVVVDIVV